MIKADVLVIGSGAAGLSFALKVAQDDSGLTVVVATKADQSESNTKYAQGGIAVVVDKTDSFENHVQDTLIAGAGSCDEAVVRMVVEEAPARLREMVEWGASFDTTKEGKLDLGKEGGHGENRIVHHKDVTGLEIEQKLLNQITQTENITLLDHHFAIDLITEHHINNKVISDKRTCFGAYILDVKSGKIEQILSKITMLACGGLGQVYAHTTNPLVATGDGVAMAYRAKAKITDIEFIQFHPTALYLPEESPSFLISEAVRGEGAYLRTKLGERFMSKYDARLELASRDIVAKAIDTELKMSGDVCVYLDCKHLKVNEFKNHFPNIYEKCLSIGINIERDEIPVVPAVHYSCGGVEVDKSGLTSITNLFSSGECSRTGLHGSNRLASNSLLEALVYSNRSYFKVKEILPSIEVLENIPDWDEEGTIAPKERVIISHNRKQLQAIMSDYVGIVKSDDRLKRAYKRVYNLYQEVEELYEKSKVSVPLCELRNLITASYLIITQSINQKKNQGVFFNSDLEKNN
ncbi:MAG: L-aspartate oxidase [Flavobacteriales bacterium]|nr:L-aspartate oxidase [Flavobacteriales bacterium]